MDRRCRESEGKAKIEGYMRVSDEEAHHRFGRLSRREGEPSIVFIVQIEPEKDISPF